MTDEQKINALMENLAKQWAEDLVRKPSITTLYQYNMLIAQVNGLDAAGHFSGTFTGGEAWGYASIWADIYGLAALSDMIGGDEDDWIAGFPIPFQV